MQKCVKGLCSHNTNKTGYNILSGYNLIISEFHILNDYKNRTFGYFLAIGLTHTPCERGTRNILYFTNYFSLQNQIIAAGNFPAIRSSLFSSNNKYSPISSKNRRKERRKLNLPPAIRKLSINNFNFNRVGLMLRVETL